MSQKNTTLKSAAEITKGDLNVMTLSEAEVVRLLDPGELLDELHDGFCGLANGDIQTPDRPEISVPGKGFNLSMPAWRPGSPIMVKMVSVFDGNLELGLPNHLAIISLFDPATGAPLCVMDGTHITGFRTAAAAVLSVREIARSNSKVATIVGAGVQGREHLQLLPLARQFDEILISSLHFEDARKLAALHPRARAVEDLEAAVRRSDVVCLASHSEKPVIQVEWVGPGTHVTSVGYAPPRGELPVSLAVTGKLYIEDDAALEPPPVGCGELQGLASGDAIRFGDALNGTAPLRESVSEITIYKAMGIAMEDLIAAEIVYNKARKQGAVGELKL
ncbi:MAG: ornithine cyclodeaminase family protein [Pseudomonadota bacterium]